MIEQQGTHASVPVIVMSGPEAQELILRGTAPENLLVQDNLDFSQAKG